VRRYAAILLSRQPLRPTRQCRWVVAAEEAVRWSIQHRYGLSGSIGLQTWELLLTLAVQNQARLKLYLPAETAGQFDRMVASTVADFDLRPDETRFVRVPLGRDKRVGMRSRDEAIAGEADLLLPVSIRSSGGMDRLLRTAAQDGRKVVDRRFQIARPDRAPGLKEDYSCLSVSDRITRPRDCLVHWTRAVSHRWPGERPIDFYRDILASNEWPRSGLATLKRIVATGRIRAGSRHLSSNVAAVSFSSLPPAEVVPLMRWRARYREMSLEPYGIGISRSIAERVGIRAVSYLDDVSRVTAEDRWWHQSTGRKTDWRTEHEYRHRGDFDLNRIPPNAITIYCRNEREATRLRERFPYNVLPLFNNAD
jgi:hypothetical protein